MNNRNSRTGVIVIMILLAALSRILPHPYNFSPLVAMALFGGSRFTNKWQAYFLPLAAYLLSDLVFAAIAKTGFYGVSQFFVYGAMVVVTALGTTLQQPKAIKVAGYSLTGSAIFWVISNYGVWLGNSMAAGTNMYEPGLTLGMTYLRALPFYNTFSTELFVNAFAGDMFYSIILFGTLALAQKTYPAAMCSRA